MFREYKNMLISVIIPAYKVEKYIHKCVDSIIAQTIFDYLEVILVDDGSPDNCGSICDEYAEKYDNIKVVHTKNGGLSAARNTGLDNSVGKFVCFVDGDDCVSEDYCEILYSLISNKKYDYSACKMYKFDDGNDVPDLSYDTNHSIKSFSNVEYFKLQLEQKEGFGVVNKMFRREVFDKIEFREGKLHEDVFFSGDLVANCHNGVIQTSKRCYFYRQTDDGIMANTRRRCDKDLVLAGRYLIEITADHCSSLYQQSLWYAVHYTWSFIDPIFVRKEFKKNRGFLIELRKLIEKYKIDYQNLELIDIITRKRMLLFCNSNFLYKVNVFIRIQRVRVYRILHKNPYVNGHGI